MNAVAALLYTDGRAASPAALSHLRAMVAAMRHRAPPAPRIAHESPAALHVDEGEEPNDGILLSVDGRIDNAAELASALALPRHASAARLIRAAYRAWDLSAADHLTGDFAFVLWDVRRQRLVAARDHFGVKPLYFASGEGFLALASEMKGLRALPAISSDVDDARVVDFLEGVLDDRSSTFYRAIRRLPAAHMLVAQGGSLSVTPYWTLDASAPTLALGEAEWVERVRDTFVRAVRCRLPCDAPAGAMLSGGLDSSSIACVARDVLAGDGRAAPLHTFSALFPGLERSDEQHYIDAVLATGSMVPHRIDATRIPPLASLDAILDHQDEPRLAANLYVSVALFGVARDAGIGVLLDGIDGDTVVSHGIRRLSELARDRRWREFAAESAGVARLRRRAPLVNVRRYALPAITSRARGGRWSAAAADLARLARHAELSPWILAREALFEPLIVEPIRRRVPWRSRRDDGAGVVRRLTNAELYAATHASERHALAGEPAVVTEHADHHWRLTRGIMAYGFEVMDHAAAAFGIEMRFPFYDRRFVELSLAVPSEYKLRGGWTRWVMRRAMEGILPPEIQWRTGKADVGVHLRQALLRHHREALCDVVYGSVRDADGYIDRHFLREQYASYAQTGGERPAMALWKALVLSRWLRRARESSRGMNYA